MRRQISLIIALIACTICWAQESNNHLYAKAGCNYSFVNGGPDWAIDNPSHRIGLVAGLEYERTFNRWGVSVGALFSMQGERKGYWADGNNMFILPVTLNYHFNQIPLTLKAGFQYGRGKELDDWAVPLGVAWRFKRFSLEATYKHGISTKNHHIYDTHPGPVSDEYKPSRYKTGHSRTITLTIAYDLPIW